VAKACGCASGGEIDWAPQGTDTVPAMLTPGEYVLKKSAVKRVGVEKLNAINSGAARRFSHGGPVGSSASESEYDEDDDAPLLPSMAPSYPPIYRNKGGSCNKRRRH